MIRSFVCPVGLRAMKYLLCEQEGEDTSEGIKVQYREWVLSMFFAQNTPYIFAIRVMYQANSFHRWRGPPPPMVEAKKWPRCIGRSKSEECLKHPSEQ